MIPGSKGRVIQIGILGLLSVIAFSMLMFLFHTSFVEEGIFYTLIMCLITAFVIGFTIYSIYTYIIDVKKIVKKLPIHAKIVIIVVISTIISIFIIGVYSCP